MHKSELKIDCIVEDDVNHGVSKKNEANQPNDITQQKSICNNAIVSKMLFITKGYWEIKCRGLKKKQRSDGGSE